jgi:hypothetical protein
MVPVAYFLLVRNLAVEHLCLVSLVRGTYSGAIEIYQTVLELVFPETGLPALGSSGKPILRIHPNVFASRMHLVAVLYKCVGAAQPPGGVVWEEGCSWLMCTSS